VVVLRSVQIRCGRLDPAAAPAGRLARWRS